MTTPTNPIERLDLGAEIKAQLARQLARQRAAALERQIAEISAHAHAAVPVPDGRLAEQWHQFLDIDPDLRCRDYTRTERTRGGAS
ncbi:hypothetical protein N4G70_29260 [Streptomyces sp. ASQP_92]|uniref:hypothetical protein n=1 Tax=Streptomyces sp. ASQP_92 TaxID=2979116 RepID=UPI0021C0FF9C|nr:hypothetical protein [Streptomyces sp. ASQP_92]MCT9092930.1 hypothetical protein [Streptomyces sp. ASQP_92]